MKLSKDENGEEMLMDIEDDEEWEKSPTPGKKWTTTLKTTRNKVRDKIEQTGKRDHGKNVSFFLSEKRL